MITKFKLFEVCDKMTLPDGDELSHEDLESIPFLYYNDELYVGYFGETHGSQAERITDYLNSYSNIVSEDDEITDDEIWDNIFDHGRIWIKHKIISWWNIPDKPTFKKIINELENKFDERDMNIQIWNNNYYLELIKDENIDENEYNKYPGEEYSKPITNAARALSYWKFIPIEEYTNGDKPKKPFVYRQTVYGE